MSPIQRAYSKMIQENKTDWSIQMAHVEEWIEKVIDSINIYFNEDGWFTLKAKEITYPKYNLN